MRVLMCMWKWMSGSTWVYVFMNLCDWTCRNIHVIEWILVQVCTQWIYYSVPSYVYVFEYIYGHVPQKAMAPHSSTLAWKNPTDGEVWWATVHGVAKSQTRLSDFPFTFHFHALEKEMATHSSVLAWRIPGTGEPGGLLSMGSHRVGHNWSELAAAAAAWASSREAMMVWAHLY